MSVQFDSSRSRWVVRWYDAGHQRSRRFQDEQAARAFEADRLQEQLAQRETATTALAEEVKRLRARVDDVERRLPTDARSSGVYPYATRDGVRWRIAVTRPDGTLTTRRGFRTHDAARLAHDRLTRTSPTESDMSFGRFWREWLAAKQPYLTEGALEDLDAHGRKRLLPHLAHLPIATLSEWHIRDWLVAITEHQDAGAVSVKTINNARAALSSALADAARNDLLPRNPCQLVPPLPVEHSGLDYLRLHEIDPYLDACTTHYRPLVELLIGTGARISEALALTWNDIDLAHGLVHIRRQRPRRGTTPRPTKGKRQRSILIGPRLTATLTTLRPRAAGPTDWLFICPRPARGRYANRPATDPPHRKTVHDWHERTLLNAGMRDLPLHALRHTAAATWLSTGHSLLFVARQLGHRSITTTEEHYGHLELNLFTEALAHTDDAIRAAAARR
jgi:integrase